MADDRKLLIWTENYWIGGCDRFLIDLLNGLRDAPVQIALAGNRHPEFDAWLGRRVPWAGRRTVIPVANLVRTPLHRLVPGRATAATSASAAGGADPGRRTTVLGAAVAAARYGQAALNLQRLERLLRRARPDVLLINNGGYPGGESCRAAAIAARRAGVPRVVHFVHNMADAPQWPAAVERALDRRIDRATDHWVTAAHRASDELSRRRPISRDRVATVHYGIPISDPPAGGRDPALRAELGFSANHPGLVAVANLEPRKGLSVLLQALARLREQGLTLPAAVIGEGPMRSQLQDEIAGRDLGGSVRLLGWREDVDAILAAAELLALPSLANECLPYVILEAMTHRLPVVSTDVAGIPDMVLDGETGRVVPPGDAGALAGALADVVTDPARARAMGERGYERVRAEFTAAGMVAEMRALLAIG